MDYNGHIDEVLLKNSLGEDNDETWYIDESR
jgi:hypothetical protein